MMVKNLGFFEEIINKELLDNYLHICECEDSGNMDIEAFCLAFSSITSLNLQIYINSDQIKILRRNLLAYKINSFMHESDKNLERIIKFCINENKNDKESLTILKLFLNNDKTSLSDNIFSKTFLYLSALAKLIDDREIYYENCLKINRALYKGYDLQMPDEFKEEEYKSNMGKLREHIKLLQM